MQIAEERSLHPHYFRKEEGLYVPSGLARSPWDPGAVAGGPISALLAHGAVDPSLDHEFAIARFTVDIFGKVPHAPATLQVETLREGRQTRLHRITIIAAGRPAGQAHILRVRRMPTPEILPPADYPPPHTVPDSPMHRSSSMGGAIRHRMLKGIAGVPGRGVAWLHTSGEFVLGHKPTPFERACFFGDFGNGYGNATHAHEWSFANLDITIQFLRMPVGEWILIDAETHMAGNGHGTANNLFADEQGVYARGYQTIFVAPGHQRHEMPAHSPA